MIGGPPRFTVVLAVLVVLAGCNFAPIETPSPTESSTASPTDVRTPTPADDAKLYDGLATDGVVDAWALGAAHEEALANTSFTTHRNRTERYGNGTPRHTQETTARYAANHDHYVWTSTSGGPADGLTRSATRLAVWSNATTTVNVLDNPEGTTYGRDHVSNTPDQTYRNRLTDLLSAMRSATVTPTTVNGSRAYRVVDRDVDDPRAIAGRIAPPRDPIESVENATVAAVIRPDGLVERIELRVTVETTTETIVVTESIRITDVGETTVPRPGWVPTAVNRTAE